MRPGRVGMTDRFDLSFYRGKTVLITGHTGFKGSWLSEILLLAGAKVIGYSLEAPTNPSLFELLGLKNRMVSIIGDVRDFKHLKEVFDEYKPEIVLHLAAQPIVRTSYEEPLYTYETNVMGTANLLECVRLSKSVRSVLNVTTDKVYFNPELANHGFKEDEPLDGFDPYSNSKSCSELVTHSYKNSFFDGVKLPVSTARAGNVIGGGDFAKDRIIPDAIRAIEEGKPIEVRNPNSTRPFQHVLEPLLAYLMIAKKQYEDFSYAGYYNVGPDDCDCVTTGQLMDLFVKTYGDGVTWVTHQQNGPHEANFLKLDCTKLKETFGWIPKTHIGEALDLVARWSKVYFSKDLNALREETDREIGEFFVF